MLFEELRSLVKIYGLPVGLCVAMTSFILFLDITGSTQTWGPLGEFELTYSLKAVLISLSWFFILVGWSIFKIVTPRLRYSKEVVESTRQAREFLATLRGGFLSYDYAGLDNAEKARYLISEEQTGARISANLQSDEVTLLFLSAVSAIKETGEFDENYSLFMKKTRWLRN